MGSLPVSGIHMNNVKRRLRLRINGKIKKRLERQR